MGLWDLGNKIQNLLSGASLRAPVTEIILSFSYVVHVVHVLHRIYNVSLLRTAINFLLLRIYIFQIIKHTSVARAFPGGRLAHPKSQNEEEN